MRRPECLVIRSTNHFNWLLSTQRSCSSTLCCIFPDIQTLLAATYSLWSYEGGKVDQLSSLQQPSKVSASLQTRTNLTVSCSILPSLVNNTPRYSKTLPLGTATPPFCPERALHPCPAANHGLRFGDARCSHSAAKCPGAS